MTFRSITALADAGLVRADEIVALEPVAARYAVAITPHLAELIAPDVVDDALAAQFVPHPDELIVDGDELSDPIGDDAHSPVPGIVHRYPDRVLLKLVHACAVYCRFCFRREVVGPGGDTTLRADEIDRAIGYIADTPDIWEVILTGGDPLILSPRRLADVMERLRAIAHVRVVRIHTRLPVAAPERIDVALVSALRRFGRALFVAVHANHEREISPAVEAACGRLIDAGIPMLGQTVLLKGVNDTPAALEALMRRMVEIRVKPYYLHHADLAPGTGRFRTSIAAGQDLVGQLRGHVSGLCQPTYVLDIPGGAGKVPLQQAAISERNADGSRTVIDRHGHSHSYPDLKESCG